jgi:hypothetical protein
LAEKLNDRLEADKFSQMGYKNRRSTIKNYLKVQERLKNKLISNIEKLHSLPTNRTVEDKFKALLAELQHFNTQ